MTRRWALLGCVSCLVAPGALAAQDEDPVERGQLVEVQVLSVHPSDVEAFEESAAKVAAAATKAGLDGAFQWHTWTRVFEYTVVSFHDTFAEFDDADAWLREFAGTDQEGAVQVAMAGFEELKVRALSRDVMEAESEWSYSPEASIDEPGGAEIIEVWIAPGKFEAFTEVTARAMTFHNQVGSPYPVTGFSTHFGDTSRMMFVTVFDDLATYAGDGRIEARAAAQGAAAEWTDILADFRGVTDDVKRSFMTYRPDLSYTGSETSGSDPGGE